MLSLGFACGWDRPPEATWSHTPWQLRAALREITTVNDIDLTYPEAARAVLRLAYARRRDGRTVSLWKHSVPARILNQVRLRRADRKLHVDAILQIGDIGRTRQPFFFLQDLSYDLLLGLSGQAGIAHQFPTLSPAAVEHLRDRQRQLYDEAQGVIAMSAWLGRSLIEVSGVSPEKVHVVHPGSTATAPRAPLAEQRRLSARRMRLLFVGRDFTRKGGPQTVSALQILRRDVAPDIELTVAGPDTWPMAGEPPAGVRFIGRVGPAAIAQLYDEHDLFVMPSHFEAFGIVFAEALARGLPCVGRNSCAMPEIILPGVNGELIASESPAELADVIARALVDDHLYATTQQRSVEAARYFSWRRAAEDTVRAIEQGLHAG